ncbi:MAG: DUF4956 domain-containing protein [Bacteroidales bacterium]|nr:DUF4956 domain-containing protein [Bacteroidales bacterium]MBR5027953.1 DUF4956 domain-containing protein [Bacteroidales bacterium]
MKEFDPDIAAEFGTGFWDSPMFGSSDDGSLMFADSLLLFLIRFGIHLLFCFSIVHFFYYRKSRRGDYYFTFLLFSVVIFMLLFLLQDAKMEAAVAIGLFAIFGMIRYRTESIPIRDMTYLFEVIGLSVINGFSKTVTHGDFAMLVIFNVLILAVNLILESVAALHRKSTKIILYEKIELIKPQNYDKLLEDLKDRTGLDIVKAEVGHINFLKDTAYIKITYVNKNNEINDIDHLTKYKGYKTM